MQWPARTRHHARPVPGAGRGRFVQVGLPAALTVLATPEAPMVHPPSPIPQSELRVNSVTLAQAGGVRRPKADGNNRGSARDIPGRGDARPPSPSSSSRTARPRAGKGAAEQVRRRCACSCAKQLRRPRLAMVPRARERRNAAPRRPVLRQKKKLAVRPEGSSLRRPSSSHQASLRRRDVRWHCPDRDRSPGRA